jgi:hypothetical protein
MLQRTSKFKLKDKIFYTGNPKLITNQNWRNILELY